MTRAFLVAVAMLLVVGCASRKEAPGQVLPNSQRLQLRPGVAVDMFGVTFEVDAIEPATSKDGIPRVAVTVRAENTTDIAVLSPDVAVTCEENRAGGEWFKDSTWETNAVLPPGVVSEGQLIAGLPYKEDAPTFPLLECTEPVLRVTATRGRDRDSIVASMTIDSEVIDAAIAAV